MTEESFFLTVAATQSESAHSREHTLSKWTATGIFTSHAMPAWMAIYIVSSSKATMETNGRSDKAVPIEDDDDNIMYEYHKNLCFWMYRLFETMWKYKNMEPKKGKFFEWSQQRLFQLVEFLLSVVNSVPDSLVCNNVILSRFLLLFCSAETKY